MAAIESDTGLTVAVLRRAQTVGARRPIANVPDAIAALSPDEIEQAIKPVPRAEFPWHTSPLEVLLHRSRVHAQGVMRAADRIARELGRPSATMSWSRRFCMTSASWCWRAPIPTTPN